MAAYPLSSLMGLLKRQFIVGLCTGLFVAESYTRRIAEFGMLLKKSIEFEMHKNAVKEL